MAEGVAYFAMGSLFGAGIAMMVMRGFVLRTLDEAMQHRREAIKTLEEAEAVLGLEDADNG